MWIFSTDGFASAVTDYDNPANLLVRARIEGDLEKMFPAARGQVQEHNDLQHDYRFRVSLPRDYVTARMIELLEEIDYFNFKDACANDRHLPYMRIWSVMNSEQTARTPAAKLSKRRYATGKAEPKLRKIKKAQKTPKALVKLDPHNSPLPFWRDEEEEAL